jgi:xanthine dehydrogenase accessory factor
VFDLIARLSQQQRPFVLATVIESAGSSPQKPGARLVLTADGALHGTVGGGAIEHHVVAAARELLGDPGASTRLLEAHLSFDLGMCCGGRMRVFLERLVPGAEARSEAEPAGARR